MLAGSQVESHSPESHSLESKSPESQSPVSLLWRATSAERPTVWAAIALTIANKMFDVLPEFLIGFAVDIAVNGDRSFVGRASGFETRWSQLVLLAIITIAIWVGESLTDYLAELRWRNLSQSIQHTTRVDCYRHMQKLEQGWFEDRSSGGLLSVLNDDVNQLERFLDSGAQEMVLVATNVVVVGIVFLTVSPMLALVAFLPIPVIVIASLRYQWRLEPLYARVRDSVGHLGATLANNLSGIATIRAFVAEEREVERVSSLSTEYRESNRQAIRLSAAFIPLIRMAILAAFVSTLLLGGRLVIEGTLAVGVFSSLVYMTQRLLWPLTRLGETFDGYQRAAASVRRLLEVLDSTPAILDGPGTLSATTPGRVQFSEVRFGYSSEQPVLRGASFTIPAGETHAIVGTTGAGKSTILKLLLRLYEVEGGAITIDGHDINSVSTASLRRVFGYVAQDTFLFEGTIRENVAYGRPEASEVEIVSALSAAEALEFATSLPRGLDTLVGERGQKLSGGQRQRLSLARAILMNPAILVLDEATSAVDNETEAAIQRSLVRVSAGRTTIVIAHRLSTVRHAHSIHVLENGVVAESGTHEDLLKAGGLYCALWRVQTGEADLGAGTS